MRSLLVSLPLLLASSLPAQGYQLKKDSSGHPVRFAAGTVHFVLSDELPEGVSRAQVMDALRRAAQSWSAFTPGVQLVIDEEEAQEQQAGYHSDGRPNENGIYFASHSWPYEPSLVAVTLLTVDPARHEILDADIVFNVAGYRFDTLPATSVAGGTFHDWESSAAHELGHAVGLAHNTELPEATMFAGSRAGEITKRLLKADDQAGALALYQDASLPPSETAPAVGCQTGEGSLPLGSALALLLLGLRSASGSPGAGHRERPRPPRRWPSP